MQVTACTSFSIATSTKRMAMGAHSRGTLATPGLLTGPAALTAVSVLAVSASSPICFPPETS